jgi:hypothetical protein
MFTYAFLFAMDSVYREWEQIIVFVNDPALSMTPLNSLLLSHWEYGIFYKNVQVISCGVIDTMDFNFSNDYLDFLSEYEPYAKRL